MTTMRREGGGWCRATIRVLIVAGLGLVGREAVEAGDEFETGEMIATFRDESTGALCPKGRYIGVLEDGDQPECTAVPGPTDWGWRRLFRPNDCTGDPDPDCLGAIPERLKPFCLYVWEGEDPFGVNDDGPFPDVLPGDFAPGGEPQADCLVAGGLAGPSPFAERRSAVFDYEAGLPKLPDPAVPMARLVFIDGSPGGEPGDPVPPEGYECQKGVGGSVCSEHGQALVRMARRLLCDPTDPSECLADVATRRALNHSHILVAPGSPPLPPIVVENGGSGVFGGGGEIAEDLGGEIAAAVAGDGTLDRVVINLSLGWNGDRYGGWEDPGEKSPAFAAVHAALAEATCRGALIFAAAGNFSGGLETTGVVNPLLPAGWAEDFVACQAGFRPLLHSVAGVDTMNSALANSRLGAMPLLVAFGDHATTCRENPDFCGSPVLTGSSVATAVVSAAAAAVWSLNPGWTPEAVSSALYDEGEVTFLNVTAPGLTGDVAHRVRVCGDLTGLPCLAAPPDPIPFVGVDPWVIDPIVSFPVDCPPDPVVTVLQEAKADEETWLGTDREVILTNGPDPLNPCPHWLNDGPADRPWSGPQPDSDTCGECGWQPAGSGRLRIDLKPRFTVRGVPVQAVTALRLKVGRAVLALANSWPLVGPGARPLVVDLDHRIVNDLCPGSQALLTMQVDIGYGLPLTISSPLLIQDVAGTCQEAD